MQIFDLFDVKQKGVIDFGDFVRGLNVFHPNAPHGDKVECKYILFSLGTLDWQKNLIAISIWLYSFLPALWFGWYRFHWKERGNSIVFFLIHHASNTRVINLVFIFPTSEPLRTWRGNYLRKNNHVSTFHWICEYIWLEDSKTFTDDSLLFSHKEQFWPDLIEAAPPETKIEQDRIKKITCIFGGGWE